MIFAERIHLWANIMVPRANITFLVKLYRVDICSKFGQTSTLYNLTKKVIFAFGTIAIHSTMSLLLSKFNCLLFYIVIRTP